MLLSESDKFSDTTYIFSTFEGYGEAQILSVTENGFKIKWIKHSQPLIQNTESILIKNQQIFPKKKNSKVYITSNNLKDAYGYLHPGSFTQPSQGISGVPGKLISDKSVPILPIYNPLTIHNKQHQLLLIKLNNLLFVSILDFLNLKSSGLNLLPDIVWNLNIILYVDGYPKLNLKVVESCLNNFLSDFTSFPLNNWIRSPLNYILDALKIDGLVYENYGITLIPAYYQEFNYKK